MSNRPPTDVTALLALVRQSGLVTEERVHDFLNGSIQSDLDPDELLSKMVSGELLTSFQATQLSAGRWRGLVLKQYALLDRLGAGGMGQVYLGKHMTLGRKVAIKVLAARLADDPIARTRLVREARAAATLDHPNIVRVYDIDTEHSPPYLVMEYLEGVSLQAAVATHGTLQAAATALCGRQVALALQHAFETGLVHRDVKPANLILDRQGQVKLLDLGIVRSVDTPGLTLAANGGKMILGTLDYLAPEQADDCSNVDTRADVYSLGATLYFLLAGHPPFPEGSAASRLARKLSDTPISIRKLRPDVPLGLSAVIDKMLARDPAERYQRPRHAADALAPWALPVPGFPDNVFESAFDNVADGISSSERSSSIATNRPRTPANTEKTLVSEVPEHTLAMVVTEPAVPSLNSTPPPIAVIRTAVQLPSLPTSIVLDPPIVQATHAAEVSHTSRWLWLAVGIGIILASLLTVALAKLSHG